MFIHIISEFHNSVRNGSEERVFSASQK